MSFIAQAVEHELARRRQAALLHSIRSPHADTVALIDTGLGDWVSDLPADEGLVDLEAGTPVRWVERQGWTKDRACGRSTSAAFAESLGSCRPTNWPGSIRGSNSSSP